MKSSELAPLLFTVYLAAASGRSPALPCFAAFLALVCFSGLFAFTQLFFQTQTQFETVPMQLIKDIKSLKDIDNTSSVNKFNKGYVSSTSFPTFAVSVGGVTPISINDSSYIERFNFVQSI